MKTFKIVAISSNRNSFGLRGIILIARDGEAWQVGANDLCIKPVGTVISIQIEHGRLNFASLGFEIPERLSDCPPNAVAEVWNESR